MVMGSGAPSTKPKAPSWASVFDDPSRMDDLVWVVAHRRDGKLNMTARDSIFAYQNSL
jgi:hypothetical protein